MKRLIDIIASLLALLILSPIYLLIAVLVYFDLGWPVIYKQRYPGLNEKLFTLYRFKTMNHKVDEKGHLLPPRQRLTTLGTVLKKYSLDDLPQFYNVLIGDMSLVGPRPVLIRSIPARNLMRLKRHAVRPGMTGWSQLHGQQKLSWEEKFQLDLYYVEHQNLWFDLKIIMISLWLFLTKKRHSPRDEAE